MRARANLVDKLIILDALCRLMIKSTLVKSFDQVTVLTVARCTLSKLTKNTHESITFPVTLNLYK